MKKKATRTDFLPARMIAVNDEGVPVVSTATRPNSSDLVVMAEADGYVVLSPDDIVIEPGSLARFERFSWSLI